MRRVMSTAALFVSVKSKRTETNAAVAVGSVYVLDSLLTAKFVFDNVLVFTPLVIPLPEPSLSTMVVEKVPTFVIVPATYVKKNEPDHA